MSNQDKAEKLFAACSDVFVELINGLLYQGEKVLTEGAMLYALSGDRRYLESITFMKADGGRNMCDLLDAMVNQGLEKGMQKGLEKGMKKGIQKGVEVLITTCKEFGITFEETASKLKEKYSLGDAEVQRDMKLYW